MRFSWRHILLLTAILVVLVSLWYTNFLANHLKKSEQQRVEVFAGALESFNSQLNAPVVSDPECQRLIDEFMNDRDFAFEQHIIESHLEGIPVIMLNESGAISGLNFGESKDDDEEFLAAELEKMISNGRIPIEIYANKIYYKNSKFIPYLTYFPAIQLLLLATFMILGYIGVTSSRRAEQNRVWVGMAKETAHQLGTPISAIMGWVSHLREIVKGDEYGNVIVGELKKDLSRLELVTERFSKIGSEPEMAIIPIGKMLENVKNYMARRTPQRVRMFFPRAYKDDLLVMANAPLIEWVFENLVRNSIDAVNGEGQINVEVYLEDQNICVDLTDTGKGIPSRQWKNIFKPGFTTKKRGWGLGLSLAKRIIENYHKGKIYVKKSTLDEGTTFTIRLPEVDM